MAPDPAGPEDPGGAQCEALSNDPNLISKPSAVRCRLVAWHEGDHWWAQGGGTSITWPTAPPPSPPAPEPACTCGPIYVCEGMHLMGCPASVSAAPPPSPPGAAKEEPTVERWRGIYKLIEECSEVLQIAGKIGPFPSGPHPDGEGDLSERLEKELADLSAAIQYVRESNGLDSRPARYDYKLGKFREWGLTGVHDIKPEVPIV